MASFRIPRGYAVDVPQYQELMEGKRTQASAIPMEAWTGLPPHVIDEIHDDPVVLMPGTFVGLATGGTASGKIFPAHTQTGTDYLSFYFDSNDTKWGLLGANTSGTAQTITAGPVNPLGVIYNKVYSFMLQAQFVNYKRNDNIGVLTDYMIQIPAITANERAIRPGDLVQVSTAGKYAGRPNSLATASQLDNVMGRLQKWDGTTASIPFIVGRCYNKLTFSRGTAVAGTKLKDDTAYSLTAEGQNEFKGLDKVQTVPGLGNAGSGTKGVPTWLLDARSDSAGTYYALNILVRL